jgi:hypothetical protein
MSLAKPKIVTQQVSPQAVAPAPAAQGADALRLGVTGDPLDDDLLNGRSSALLGKLRLRVGRPANVLAGAGGIGSSDIARSGGVGAASQASTGGSSGGSDSGASSTGTAGGGSSFSGGASSGQLKLPRKVLE